MPSFLEQTIAESKRESSKHFHRGAAGNGPSVSSAGTLAPGGDGMGTIRSNENVSIRSEQLQRYQGSVFGAISALARRCANQRVHVARVMTGSKQKRTGLRPAKDAVPEWLKGDLRRLEELPDHYLANVFRKPNPRMTPWIMKAVSVIQMELAGSTYLWVNPPSKPVPPGVPFDQLDYNDRHQLWPLPPPWVTQVPGDDKLRPRWKIQRPGSNEYVVVPNDQIIQIYSPDPADPYGSHSALQAMSRTVAADEAITDAQRRIFIQGAFPGLMFTIGRHPDAMSAGDSGRPFLTKEQRAQITAWVESAYTGVVKYGKPLIIDALIEKVDMLHRQAREMDFLSSSKVTEGKVNRGFGINPIIQGQIESVNRASAAAADSLFCGNAVNPRLSLISEAYTAWLAPHFAAPGEALACWIEPAAPIDPEMEKERMALGIRSGCVFMNEMREFCRLPPTEGGDNLLVTPGGLFPWSEVNDEDGMPFQQPGGRPPGGQNLAAYHPDFQKLLLDSPRVLEALGGSMDE